MSCQGDMCGEFQDEPENPTGQCTPYRLKRSCELPSLYLNQPQTVTVLCPEGTEGEVISVTIPAGTVNNAFSVTAANAAALALATAQAAALRALSPCLYWNTEQVCSDVCPEGTTGETITVTIPAGSFSSTVSVSEANAAALAEACAEVAELRAAAPCTPEPEPEEEPGSLWAMGLNTTHQLGVGDDLARSVPALVDEETSGLHWVKVSSGRYHGLGLKSDGSIWSWGQNFSGQLGNGSFSTYPSTVNDHYRATQIGSGTDWSDISVSTEYSMALKSDKTLWTWGLNASGQLGDGTNDNVLTPTQVGSATDWIKISAGRQHSLALKEDFTLWGSGSSTDGQLGTGPSVTETFIQIAGEWADMSAGDATSFGVKTDGTLWRIGSTSGGAITQIGSDTDWESVKGGDFFQCIAARKTDGTLWTMGSNSVGQLGLGDTDPRTEMTQVGTDTWLDYSVSLSNHMVGVKSDGTMWGWGADNSCQLGQGAAASIRSSPVQIGPDNYWLRATAGYVYSNGIRSTVTAPPSPDGVSGVLLGGYVTVAGGYHIHTFDGSATLQALDTDGVTFDVLYAGGGGGGGPLGGGGAGAFVKQTGISIANGTYPVTIGGRGAGGGGSETAGSNGGTTTFNGTSAVGGGGGGAHSSTSSATGKDGASGGGGGGNPDGGAGGAAGGTGSAGYDGGTGDNGLLSKAGGGGGGSSAVGSDATDGVGGDGGDGTSDSITGSAVNYCAGGGGYGQTTRGSGGSPLFAGGSGGQSGSVAGEWGATPGSGGGGGDPSGDGAKGVLIIRYLTPA